MNCERCGGFKVLDYFDGPFRCHGFRCVNCGAITDMRIVLPAQTREVIPPQSRTKRARRPLFVMPPAEMAHTSQTEHQP